MLVALPACVTLTVCPATITLKVRPVDPVLGCVIKATVPLPLPYAPVVICATTSLAAAAHEQVLVAVTAMLELPPLAGTFSVPGLALKLHTGAAACVIVKVCPNA